MNIRSQISDEINKLLRQPGHESHGRLNLQWGTGWLDVQLERVQPLGCALWQLDVQTQQTANTSMDAMRHAGEKLVQRVRYLLEPLQVHEVDSQQRAVQLRSSPPQRQAETVRYYEVTAEADGSWRLVRYEKETGQPRRQVAAMLTLEVLQQVCQDVVDVATEA